MSLSVTLLVVAALCALVPIVSLGLRPPASIRDLEKSFVVGIATLAVGAFVASRTHALGRFGIAHLAYLLIVVSGPGLLVGWYLTALIRRSRTMLLSLGALGGVVIALLGVWGTHIEPNWLRTDFAALQAPVQKPITIGVLADVQTPNIDQHEWRSVEMLLAEQPDMVVVPGDLFQGDALVIAAVTPDFIALLAELVANVPVVAVVSGDSDRPDQLRPIVEAAGATYLDNQITEVVVNGQPVRLAGVTVFQATSRLNVIAELGVPTDALTVLVSHRPDVVFELPSGSDVDLIVSGHTHGGQISLPFIGPPVTLSDVPRSVAAGGLGLVDNFPVYVSTGVGLERRSAPQVRFGVRPSVGIITVTPN